MIRRILSGIGLLSVGAAASTVLLWSYNQPEPPATVPMTASSAKLPDTQHMDSLAPSNEYMENLEEELNHYREWAFQLETQVIEFESRLSVLEEAVTATIGERKEKISPQTESAAATTGPSGQQPSLSVPNLVDGGLDPQLAARIVNRQNRLEMQQLELRDRSVRNGTFGQEAYFKELRELKGDSSDLRTEIGDSAYDRYLYAMGQSNRVLVTSVIPESPAEHAGLEGGDLILEYDGQRLFNWSELRNATTQGERGEVVQITIQRNQSRFSLSVPRGPLGVRMGSRRVNPSIGW